MIYDVEVMDEVNSSSIEEESQGCKSWSWRLVNVFFSFLLFSSLFLNVLFPEINPCFNAFLSIYTKECL